MSGDDEEENELDVWDQVGAVALLPPGSQHYSTGPRAGARRRSSFEFFLDSATSMILTS